MPRKSARQSPIVPEAEKHPLARRIVRLRRRVQLLLVLRGLALVAAVVIAGAMVASLLDYVFRFEDLSGRLLVWLSLLGISALSVYRFLVQPLTVPWHTVELAHLLEQHFPKLDGGLATSLEFLETPADDPVWGSAELRRATIEQTTAAAESIDLSAAVRTRAVWRSLLAASTLAALALVLALLAPGAARVALARLINPFGQIRWPQRYELVVLNPVRYVARGETFRILVVDGHGKRPPGDARIGYRFQSAGGRAVEQWQPLQYVDAQAARAIAATDDPRLAAGALFAQRANVTRPFAYRVEGGDDRNMPWTPVHVLEPPSLSSLRVRIVPPEYTGWSPRNSQPHIRTLVGSRAELTATAAGTLARVTLCLNDGARLQAHPADEEGRKWTASFVVEKSGAYWFELVDRRGIAGGADQSWAIQAIADSPPSVVIERPQATVFATPQASVLLQILAKDDLAIRRIGVELDRTDRPQRPHDAFRLYERPAAAELQQTDDQPARGGDSHRVEYQWDLAPLQLAAGAEVTLVATASDYRPNLAKSDPRRLVIVTPEQLAERLAERQAALVKELARALEIEQQVRRQTHQVQLQAESGSQLDTLQVDRLQGAQLSQRQVRRLLSDTTEGVPGLIADLLDQIRSNKIDDPATVRRLEQLREQLLQLEKTRLVPIGRELTFAVKSLRSRLQRNEAGHKVPIPPEARAALVGSLKQAVDHEDEVITALKQLLGGLGRWNQFREFQAAWNRLFERQKELIAETRRLAKQTLTKTLDQLSPEETASLRVLAQQQAELARETVKAIEQMEAALETFAKSDPGAAETVSQALRHARNSALDAQMTAAAEQLGGNRMGQAIQSQQTAEQLLREILDRLANRPENQLGQVAQRLQAAAEALQRLTEQQQTLRSDMEQAGRTEEEEQRKQQLTQLADRQAELRQKTGRLTENLRNALANRLAEWLTKAAEKMLQATQDAKNDSADTASRWAQSAADDLRRAAQLLAEEIRRVQQGVAAEQLGRVVDALDNLHRRQRELLEATRQLAAQMQAVPTPTRNQRAEAITLANRQEEIRTDAEALRSALDRAAVFRWLLASASQAMEQSSGLLRGLQTSRATEAENQAVAYIEQLLEAFRAERQQANQPTGPQQAGRQQDDNRQAADPFLFAQLKLIRQVQEQIYAETRKLEEQFGNTEPLPQQARQRYTELSNRQRELAALLLQIGASSTPANGTKPAGDSPLLRDSPEEAPPGMPEEQPGQRP